MLNYDGILPLFEHIIRCALSLSGAITSLLTLHSMDGMTSQYTVP